MESGNSENSSYRDDKWYDEEGKIEPGIMYGFVRLRLSNHTDLPCLQDTALIRELHVYGQVATCTKTNENKQIEVQHKGFGTQLMKKAEEIAYQHHYYRIAVISGVGVRNYYRKMGYRLCDTFMIKETSDFFKIQNEIYLIYCKFDIQFIYHTVFLLVVGLCDIVFKNNDRKLLTIKK